MSSTVIHAPQKIGLGARRLMYIAAGLAALVLIVAVMVSTAGTSPAPTAIGRGVPPAHPSKAANQAAIRHAAAGRIPVGSGVRFGRSRPAPR
jgi:hypothetical protein